MSMSEFFWSDVDSDAAREQHEAQVERARVAVAGAWPFLSEATSRNDYLNRLSLVEDRIHNAVASATSTDAEFASVLGALHASLDEDWYTLREARVREARVKRARAKRAAQRKHAGGWAVYDGMANDRRLTPPVGTREEAEQARIEYLDQNPEADPSWVYVGTTFFGEATRKRAQGDEIEPDEPTGQGAADVDDVPTPGQEVADYPQPEGEGEPGSTPDGEGEWANEDGEAREARKTAVSLSNVGIDPETGNGVGTDPSGQRVQFHLSESDRQQLKDVLLSDLAVNFSGVDVPESDIIRQSRRRAGGARGRGSAGLSLAQVRTAAEQYAILMPSDNNSLATHDGMTKQQAEELLRTYDFGPGAKVVTLEEAERLQGQARKQAAGYYGGGEIPEDLIRALNNRQYGGEATVTKGEQQSRVDVDGGYYVMEGVTLRGPYGEYGTIYSEGDGWIMQFFDGSFLRIWREGNGYAVDSYGQKSSLDRYMATRKDAAGGSSYQRGYDHGLMDGSGGFSSQKKDEDSYNWNRDYRRGYDEGLAEGQTKGPYEKVHTDPTKWASRKVAWSIDDVRRVVRNWQYETVDGMMLDATSAYLLMQVYDAIDEGHKQRLSDQPLDVAVDMAAKVLNRAAKKAGRKVPSVVARRLTKNAISVNLVTGNGEVLIRAPGESASSIKRMLRSSNIDAQVIDNGDDTFEVSVAKSRTQDAAQILRNATRKQAASTLDEAIETAKQNLPIQKKVVAPHAQTGYTILQKGDGRYSVHEDSAWGDRSGGFLPSSGPPEGTPVAKVDLDGNVQMLGSRTAALSAGDRVEVISDTESQDGSTTIPAGSVLTINEVEDQGDPDARGGLLHTTFNGNPVYLSEGDVRKSSSRTAETHAPYRIQESNGQYKVVNDNGETKGTHDTWEQAREQQKALYRNVPGAPEQAERKSESSRRVAFDDGHRLGQPNPPYHVEDLDPSGTAHTVVCDVPGCDWSDALTNVAPNFLWSDHARQVRNQAVDMLHDLSTARKVEVEQIGPRQFLWAVSDDERLYGSGIAPTRSLARREAAQHLGDNSRGNNPYTPVGESNPFGEQGNPYDLTGEDVTDQGPLAEDMAGPVSIEGPPQTTRPRGGGEQDGAPADPSSPEGPQPVGEAAAGRNRR